MKRRILVADSDERLQHAFSTIFSKEDYEILYASNGKEVEKLTDRMKPDIYIVNVNLPKINGIELYKKLQKEKVLDKATFFFLKDENDRTELLGYQAAGVIEKPVNFFRVYETITKEDEVIELTDLVEEESEVSGARTKEPAVGELESPLGAPTTGRRERVAEQQVPEERPSEPVPQEGRRIETALGERLRDAMGSALGTFGEEEAPGAPPLEDQFRAAIAQVMEQASRELAARLAPVLSEYVEEYVKRILLEVAEKVIREEIDKLLKESAT